MIERRLASIDKSSEEAEGLMAEASALREEYGHLIAEASAHHRPLPERFPDSEEVLLE